MKENIDKFIDALRASLDHETFIKLTLGNYKGADKHLQKLSARLIETRKGRQLSLQYRYDTRNIVKNHTPEEAVDLVRGFLDGDFFSGHLFTTEGDYQLDISKKGKSRLHFLKPTFQTVLPTEHNRAKSLQIDPDRPYLHSLGITTDQGRVRDKQQDKWRQINKFVEIVSSLFDNSLLNDRKQLNIVDMGSGKGYLTFAVYDHFKNTRRLDIQVTGVEARRELVELCNRIAAENDFDGLSFVQGTIADFDVSEAHILIALHACDTATDDALHKGITSKASIIIAAPCCHKEIRPQIKPPEMFSGVLKHGVMLERTAETITDGLRALLLERSGYSTKLFEFVPVEHTPKNNMLAAVRNTKPVVTERADRQIREIKEFYGIEHQRLEDLVS